MCQQHWEEAISHYKIIIEEKIDPTLNLLWGYGWFHYRIGKAYLRKGDLCRAVQSFKQATEDLACLLSQKPDILEVTLRGLLIALVGLEISLQETPEQFVTFCCDFKERHADVLKTIPLGQWYLKSAKPSEQFSHLAFADNFDRESIHPSWCWIDRFGDCSYRKVKPHGVEISAANSRGFDGLNVSAPRFMRELSGDFAVEVCVLPASDDKPMIGGLLVWQDNDNFLRFDIGALGQDEVRLYGYINGKEQTVGRGLLHRQALPTTYLRLERNGDEFSSYCSEDGERWFTCGTVTLPLDDPVEIGIHAIGTIDRTIYCGAYKEGTATVFRGFKLWTLLLSSEQ